MSNVTILENRPNLTTGRNVQAIIPKDLIETTMLAKTICASGLAPKGLDTPEKITIAIMHGAELGLKPMMALRNIAIVNGRPSIYGDAAPALVRSSGVCEYIDERIEGTGDDRAAVCETKRKGETRPVIKRFSVLDAKKARLWNKSGPWSDYPERMLTMRARSFALRDAYADILGGLPLKEEAEDIPVDPAFAEPASTKAQEIDVTPTQEAIPDNSFDLQTSIETRNIMIAAIDMAQNGKDLNVWISQNDPTYDRLLEADKQIVIEAIKDKKSSLRKGAA